jgi:MFS transporter, DHA1 family, inner membrane transport protein
MLLSRLRTSGSAARRKAELPATLARSASAGIVRSPVTLCCYLVLAYFMFMLTLQATVVPFLKSDLDLSYGAVGLHASAIAVGAILVGLLGERFVRRLGRRSVLMLGMIGCIAGALLLAAAAQPSVSILGCALIGIGGSLLPTVAFAVLADVHGADRSIVINESAALNYGLAMLAPLLTGLCLWLSLGWRGALMIAGVIGGLVIIACRAVAVPDGSEAPAGTDTARLPAAFWIYWGAMTFGIAIEYSILLWASEYLERVVGLDKAQAASGAAAFVLGMFIGRASGSVWARFIAVEQLLIAQLAVTLVGFLIYWGVSQPAVAIIGLLVLGTGVSLLFPLTVGLAMGAAGPASDKASARSTIAFGVALLTMPLMLGGLADRTGLSNAHWLVPILILATLVAFGIGRMIEKRR